MFFLSHLKGEFTDTRRATKTPMYKRFSRDRLTVKQSAIKIDACRVDACHVSANACLSDKGATQKLRIRI